MVQWFIVSYDSANKQKVTAKPIVSEHQSKWKCNGATADQCKQRGVLCGKGLVKDHGGHLVNQLFISFWVLKYNTWKANKNS